MNAISDFVEVKDHTIKYQLPNDFLATRVQLIILPVEELPKKNSKSSRLKSLRGTIDGQRAESLNSHLKSIREEW